MTNPSENQVTVVESGNGPYAEFVAAGRHVMGADEPERLGGHDTGASPYEYLMAGLGACTAMTLRMYANRHNWPLETITVEVRHAKAASADGESPVDRFERLIHLKGGLTEDQKARLLAIAGKCPVSQTLQRASVVVSRLAEADTAKSS